MSETLSIIGVGLIGGSFALGLKAAGFAGRIVGAGRREPPLRRAVELGVVDTWSTDLAAAVRGSDIVLLAVPMLAMRAVLERIAPALAPGAIVTDAGSVKGSLVRDAAETLPASARLVPAHPIAGTERSGVEAAFASLFRGRRVILTPAPDSDPQAVARVRELWQMTGAVVETLDVGTHDRVLAATSHLPHMLAYGLVDTLARMQTHEEIFRYAAGGFRDFTRIASSDPLMWRDICIANREALLGVLRHYAADLAQLTALVEAGDAEGLMQLFSRAKQARDAHIAETLPGSE